MAIPPPKNPSGGPPPGKKPSPERRDKGAAPGPDPGVGLQSNPSQPVLPALYSPGETPPPTPSSVAPTRIVPSSPPPGPPGSASAGSVPSSSPPPLASPGSPPSGGGGFPRSQSSEPEQIGGYRIIRTLGVGGMGLVYLGFDPQLERYVAIKVMLEKLGRESHYLERLRREARAAAQLHHPGIVTVHSMGEEGGRIFFVMEYVEGTDLGTLVRREGPIALSRAFEIIRQAADALAYAWDRQIVHRDIKPSNLLLTREGRVKVADFGLAKQLDSNLTLTETGSTVGSPYYMSPEQGMGDPVDFRTDIYALGCTLFCFLTGRAPYDATSPLAILMKHARETIPNPPEIASLLDGEVTRLLDWMMAKDKNGRPASYGDLMDELGRLLALTGTEPRLAGLVPGSAGPAGSGTGGTGRSVLPLPAAPPLSSPTPEKTAGASPPAEPTLPLSLPSLSSPAGSAAQASSGSPAGAPARKRRPPLLLVAAGVGVAVLALGIGLLMGSRHGASETSLNSTAAQPAASTMAVSSSPASSAVLQETPVAAVASSQAPAPEGSPPPPPPPTAVPESAALSGETGSLSSGNSLSAGAAASGEQPSMPGQGPLDAFPGPNAADSGMGRLGRIRGMLQIIRGLRKWDFESVSAHIQQELNRTDLSGYDGENLKALNDAVGELRNYRNQYITQVRLVLPKPMDFRGQSFTVTDVKGAGIQVKGTDGKPSFIQWDEIPARQIELFFMKVVPPNDKVTRYRAALLLTFIQSPNAEPAWDAYRKDFGKDPGFAEQARAGQVLSRVAMLVDRRPPRRPGFFPPPPGLGRPFPPRR